jgi:hypothetical protein
MKAMSNLEAKEKGLKERVDSVSKKEAGASSKASELDQQL